MGLFVDEQVKVYHKTNTWLGLAERRRRTETTSATALNLYNGEQGLKSPRISKSPLEQFETI